jgi:hypothetical protein
MGPHYSFSNTPRLYTDQPSFLCKSIKMDPVSLISEISADLFSAPSDFALAHCVSRDFAMSKGIARLFRDRFGRVNELKAQNPLLGGISYLNIDGRFVFYLVTKEKYFQKPTYERLIMSLMAMKEMCIQNGVGKVAIPRIGCGLDKLAWTKVRKIIETVFRETGIIVCVYSI